jgi:hypothetical protein
MIATEGEKGRDVRARVPALGDVIVILWVRFESDLAPTIHALKIKPAQKRDIAICSAICCGL